MNKYRDEMTNKYRKEGVKTIVSSDIGFFESYILMWKRYFDFEGTSTRKEFWYPYLINLGIGLAYQVALESIFDFTLLGALVLIYGIYVIANFFPSLALMVRRLHDTGVSGWNYLWFLTIIGGVYVIYLLARESKY